MGKGCKIEEKKVLNSFTLPRKQSNNDTERCVGQNDLSQKNHQEMENKKGEKRWGSGVRYLGFLIE